MQLITGEIGRISVTQGRDLPTPYWLSIVKWSAFKLHIGNEHNEYIIFRHT